MFSSCARFNFFHDTLMLTQAECFLRAFPTIVPNFYSHFFGIYSGSAEQEGGISGLKPFSAGKTPIFLILRARNTFPVDQWTIWNSLFEYDFEVMLQVWKLLTTKTDSKSGIVWRFGQVQSDFFPTQNFLKFVSNVVWPNIIKQIIIRVFCRAIWARRATHTLRLSVTPLTVMTFEPFSKFLK